MKKRLSQPLVKAQYDRLRKLLLVNALSPLALILSFQFTRSFVVESMHVVLKGVVLTQLKLTLDKAQATPMVHLQDAWSDQTAHKAVEEFQVPEGSQPALPRRRTV